MHMGFGILLCVLDPEHETIRPTNDPLVPYLPAALGIKRRAIEHQTTVIAFANFIGELIVFDNSHQLASAFRMFIADEFTDHVEENGNEWTSGGDDPNHFHPDYFGKGYRWHNPRLDRMELAYRKAKRVFEADGRRVVNATLGGKLEVFERVDYDSLF